MICRNLGTMRKKQTSIHLPVFKFLNMRDTQKKISEKIFRQYYLNHIDYAISQVKKFFSTDVEKLIGTDETEDSKKGKLGSNLPELFKLLREL